jgi:hypothetical protein
MGEVKKKKEGGAEEEEEGKVVLMLNCLSTMPLRYLGE